METSQVVSKINELAKSLLSLDKNDNYNLYLEKERELQDYVYRYTISIDNKSTQESHKYYNFSQEILFSIRKALEIFDVEKGEFIPLYKKILDNKIKTTLLESQDSRHGIVVPVNKQRDINKINKLVQQEHLNINLNDDLIYISNELGFDFNYVYDLVKINANAVAIINEKSSNAKNDSDDVIDLFDTVKGIDEVDSKIIEHDKLIELLDQIDCVYEKQRSDTKKVIRYMLTLEFLPLCDYLTIDEMYNYSFIEWELVDSNIASIEKPLLKDISARLGKLPSSISRTYNNFIFNLRNQLKIMV